MINVTPKIMINDLLGIPYKEEGRDLSGLDCWGLLIWCFKHYRHIDLLDIYNYSKHWSKYDNEERKRISKFIRDYKRQWITIEKPTFFDVILFWGENGVISHTGLYLHKKTFIECKETGVTTRKIYEVDATKIEGIYRYDNSQKHS